ncbi:MAG: DUF2062 domain-containing protein [Rhodocyclaceae bacterium]|nr:DUF2062 domain-containing protein [Rhodocyclaceae bacterium]
MNLKAILQKGFWMIRWRRLIPNRETLMASRWLRWLAPWLGHPKLWHWSRRGVALGVALGVFFGLLIPLAQIPVTAAAAIVLRANLPAAAASTLITNPVTFAPLYYGAYRMGTWVTGETGSSPDTLKAAPTDADMTLWQRLTALGKQLVVGLSILAVSAGLATYVLIDLAWRWHIAQRRRRSVRHAIELSTPRKPS